MSFHFLSFLKHSSHFFPYLSPVVASRSKSLSSFLISVQPVWGCGEFSGSMDWRGNGLRVGGPVIQQIPQVMVKNLNKCTSVKWVESSNPHVNWSQVGKKPESQTGKQLEGSRGIRRNGWDGDVAEMTRVSQVAAAARAQVWLGECPSATDNQGGPASAW